MDNMSRGNLKSLCETAPNGAFESADILARYLSRQMGFDISPQQASAAASLAGRPVVEWLQVIHVTA